MSNDYYQNCPFPKPGTVKKKKLENGWKDKPNRVCWYCGKRGAERHEVFQGPYRQTSIEMGFQVDVCMEHHKMLHANGTDWSKIEHKKWRMHYQQQYEQKLIDTGISPEQARELWIQMMGRNYI